jgi:hypothetical protein
MDNCFTCQSRPECDIYADKGVIEGCPGWKPTDRLDIRRSIDAGRPVSDNEPADDRMNKPMPKWLAYMIIFAAAAAIGSVAAYYIDPTGLLCGILAVLIYRQLDRKQEGE